MQKRYFAIVCIPWNWDLSCTGSIWSVNCIWLEYFWLYMVTDQDFSFLVPDSCLATVRNCNSIRADFTEVIHQDISFFLVPDSCFATVINGNSISARTQKWLTPMTLFSTCFKGHTIFYILQQCTSRVYIIWTTFTSTNNIIDFICVFWSHPCWIIFISARCY